MSSIPPVESPSVLSFYTRVLQQAGKTVVKIIKHEEYQGKVEVDTVSIITYNKKGEEVKSVQQSTLDKMA